MVGNPFESIKNRDSLVFFVPQQVKGNPRYYFILFNSFYYFKHSFYFYIKNQSGSKRYSMTCILFKKPFCIYSIIRFLEIKITSGQDPTSFFSRYRKMILFLKTASGIIFFPERSSGLPKVNP